MFAPQKVVGSNKTMLAFSNAHMNVTYSRNMLNIMNDGIFFIQYQDRLIPFETTPDFHI